ncbi:MAG: FG-GAP repeat protein [Planctomycetes bacterium]|nr:FG-GAP repeat protein [Planctomycetota bacterium]
MWRIASALITFFLLSVSPALAQRSTPVQLLHPSGAGGDRFGQAVAIDGDTMIVGAPNDAVGGNAFQGSAYVFTRSGTTWTQQAQLQASGGEAFDEFGISVSLSGDTALVAAYRDDVGANGNQGSAYVFTRSGSMWTLQAQLTATGGAAGDNFGVSVALAGDTALVGAYLDSVGANSQQGSAYVFTRSGTTWTQQAQLTASGGAANDQFGFAVALSGDTALLGAYRDDVGANPDQGSAWFTRIADAPAEDSVLAQNNTIGVSYPTLAAAMTPAANWQQITGTEAAWRTASSLDTAGRRLVLQSGGDIRMPSTSAITLGGSSTLGTPPSGTVEIFGALSVPASQFGAVATDSFPLGSRGNLRLFTNAQLVIDAPRAIVEAPTQIDSRAALDLRGDAAVYGNLTAALYSEVSASGSLTNFGTWTVTGGSIGATVFTNRDSLAVGGTSGIFGDLTNEVGATTIITSGRLFVVGTLINNDTISGAICPNCLGGPPALDTAGDLNLGSAANLSMPFDSALVRAGGNFNCAINSNTRYDLSLATLQLEGAGAEQTLEVMSADIGPVALGLDRTLTGHYPIGVLRIGPSPSTARLVDTHDNDTLGQTSCEAIYVDELVIHAGSRLINTSCRIYYNTLINNGTVDVPANLVQIAPPCLADFNGDTVVDFFDYLDFVAAFSSNDPAADFNADTTIDFFDYLDFVAAFSQGC